MAISIKQLTINTKVNKKQSSQGGGKNTNTQSAGLSKLQTEAIIEETIKRMREIFEYEYRP